MFRQDSPDFPKSTGLGLLIYIMATGWQILSENSVLKVKNTKNSAKNRGNQNHQRKLPNFTMENFSPLWFQNHFLVINHSS
jgi:hypothetical protein